MKKKVFLVGIFLSVSLLFLTGLNGDNPGREDFDLDNIQIKTTISNPHQYSEGVKYLFINGVLVLDYGKYNDKLPGKVLLLKKSE